MCIFRKKKNLRMPVPHPTSRMTLPLMRCGFFMIASLHFTKKKQKKMQGCDHEKKNAEMRPFTKKKMTLPNKNDSIWYTHAVLQ